MKQISLAIIGLILFLGFNACEDAMNEVKTETPETFDYSTMTASELEIAGMSFDEAIDEESHAVAMNGGTPGGFIDGVAPHTPPCATVTVSGEDYPKEIVITFDEECEDRHGKTKSGQIVINISDDMQNEGAEKTVEFVDFSVGDHQISGNKTVTNLGQNQDGNWIIEMESSQTITFADGTQVSRSNTETHEWISGFDTPEKEDDIFYKTGSGTMTKEDGTVCSRTILEPVLIDHSCRYPLSGVVEMNDGDTVSVIDFGDGECDNLATITKDGETTEIEIPEYGKPKDGKGPHGKGSGKGDGKGNGKGGHHGGGFGG